MKRVSVKRALAMVVLSLAAILVLAFTADYLSVRFGIPNHRAQFDYFDVRHLYAVKLKNRKTSYMYDKPQSMECVNALFPHYGDTPCWYMKRHTVIQENLDSGPFGPWIDTP
jgi:hypothetical protein